MSYFVLLLTLYVATALDATIAIHAQFAGAAPQLVLLAGLAWICVYRGPRAYVGAALAGLAADLAGTGRLGICFALMTSAALIVNGLSRWLPLGRPALQAALVSLGTTVSVAVISCDGAGLHSAATRFSALAAWSAMTGAYTGAVAWPVLCFVARRRRYACV